MNREAKTFEIMVGDQKMRFAYTFLSNFVAYDPRWRHESTVFVCLLRQLPISKSIPIKDFVGQAVFNPNDRDFDPEKAKTLAFRRACEKFYANSVATGPDWTLAPKKNGFWDLCRKARGAAEHQLAQPPIAVPADVLDYVDMV